MNKTQLVDALAARLGDRRTAASAVDGLLETIVETVKGGESVALTGFGVFSRRERSARTARNPRTGEAVAVPAGGVPAFRPGSGFRTAVGGGPAGASTAARRRAATPPPRTTPSRRRSLDPAAPADAAPRRARTVPPADAPSVNGVAVAPPATAGKAQVTAAPAKDKPKAVKAKKGDKPAKKPKKK